MNTPISAYPLSWPVAWKRTAQHMRVTAKFGKAGSHRGAYVPHRAITLAEGRERVLVQLERMGIDAQDVVLSTNVRTRLDGLPRSGEPEPADSGAAVYWQERSGARRVMAIDIYNRVADNLAAIAASLDALRAIERHGGAAILDRAFAGFTALPAPIVAGMKRDWRAVLGLQEVLRPTTADVQQAYRRLAAELHPDRGGNDAVMAELNIARDEALKALA